ncbi:MAG: VOC family protein [Alphaproteobacteria bacterium]|nr:VOC family protein [Alphaproteobacteria bacterium]
MAELNHLIVWSKDKQASAKFLADILGVPVGEPWGHFVPVRLSNGVAMDFLDADSVSAQHYAFLVGDAEFDAAFARLQSRGVPYYADPARQQRGEINHHWGGRGVYFEDPDGHVLELITKPYGKLEELTR